MEDTNLITVNKYIPDYENDYREVIEPSFIQTQTMVDYDSDNFKYGLGYYSSSEQTSVGASSWRNDPMFFFQDPLFPSFDIILDVTRSPLFIVDEGTNYKYSLSRFLDNYNNINSIATRQKLHSEFLKTLYTLFNTEFNQIDRNKSYYINSIAGLETLNKRMIEFEKDKITITLNEDVSMISSYLSFLYKNLAYSYRDQRHMIPANLLRFNMYIRISDVRNMYFFTGSGSTLSFDKSYQIYLLRDCTFDFFKSKNFEDSITIAGFETGKPDKPANLLFDIYFKSVEIETNNPLIMESFVLGPENSGTLRLNNKDKNIVSTNNLNTVFLNNKKSVDTFSDELDKSSNYNNDTNIVQNNILSADEKQSKGTQSSYDETFGKTSSQIWDGSDKTRDSEISRFPIYNTGTGFDGEGDTRFINSTPGDEPSWLPGGDGLTLFEVEHNFKDTQLSNIDPKNKNVNNAEPDRIEYLNQGFDYLNSLNSEFYFNRLFQLPAFIISKFFGGIHGFLPGIPPLRVHPLFPPFTEHTIYGGSRAGGMPSVNKKLDNIFPTKTLDGDVVNLTADPPEYLDGETITFHATPDKYLEGETISITTNQENTLDGEFIPFALRPPQSLDGEFIPFALRPPQSLDGEFIPFALRPPKPFNVHINNTAPPREFLYLGDLANYEGKWEPIEEIYLTDKTERSFKDLGNLYENNYDQRDIDMGSLFSKVDKNKELDEVYLYTKSDETQSLQDERVYNNQNNVNKDPQSVRIDNSVEDKTSIETVYVYDNNINNNKNLNNVRVYNNLTNEKIMPIIDLYDNTPNNLQMPVLNINNNTPKKDEMKELYVYSNSTTKPNIELINVSGNIKNREFKDLGKVNEPSNIQKLIDTKYIYSNVNKKETILDRLYNNEDFIRYFTETRIDTTHSKNNILNEKDAYRLSNSSNIEKTLDKIRVNDDPKMKLSSDLGNIDTNVRIKEDGLVGDKINQQQETKQNELAGETIR